MFVIDYSTTPGCSFRRILFSFLPNIPNPKTTRTGLLVFPVSVSLSLQSVARRHRFSADHGNSYSTPHPPQQPHVTFESLQSPWQLQPAMWSSGRESPIWGLSHMLLGSSPVLVGKPAHVSSYCSPSCYWAIMVFMWLLVLPLLLVLLLLLLPLRRLLLLGLTICFFPISTSIQSIQSIFWSILRSSDLRRKSESIIGIICICQESEICPLNQGPASQTWLCSHKKKNEPIWVWVNTYRYIFSGLFTSINPSYDLGFTRYQAFDPSTRFRDPDNWAPQLQSRMVTWDDQKRRRLSETGDPEKDHVFSWKSMENVWKMYRNVMSRTWLLSICSKHSIWSMKILKNWFRW